MPVIAAFMGIIIKMYFRQAEHNPPHVHVLYGEGACALSLADASVMDGGIPAKQLRMARRWVLLHRDELTEMWDTQRFHRLPAL